MLQSSIGRSALIGAGVVGLTFAGAAATAGTTVFQLMDHPDSNAAPPGYGLRLDNLFGGLSGASGGVTTFSFDATNDVYLSVTDSGSDITINVFGTVFGGEDAGSSYGFGEGAYDLSFTFQFNVAEDGTGWVVAPSSSGNQGTLVSQGNSDVPAGESFHFYDFSGNSFLFLQDDHRLSGHSERNQGFWVGRGWNTYDSSGAETSGTQDWLFMGTPIPSPMAAGLGLVGLGGVMGARRRRM